MTAEEKKNYVAKILLMPIEVLTSREIKTTIEAKDKMQIIKTSMRYKPPGSKSRGALDPDVSDIAIGFYERVYNLKEIKYSNGDSVFLDGKLLQNRYPVNWQFIGDTMNSVNKEINYHCLANFWLIPGEIGRRLGEFSKATKYKDKLDDFLEGLKNEYCDYSNRFSDYFKHFNSFDIFIKKHFLQGCIADNGDIKKLSCPEDIEKMIASRADEIAQEKYEVLYNNFFEKLEPHNANSSTNGIGCSITDKFDTLSI